ncbi:AraC family transcriptional regulator ligand-binding domain-containing protein [Sulfitobacter sp. D35]|uniref:AraC-like transcriptional regulator QhpR n=1 Tax=Sulfitobacter sp. D35 TaxID=3083252 RepID=UPI00296EDC3F|nr:AraC family transcriptional regulator ligand-binding domain-containing protein [Sulfitobacter sp. D35]MDW4497368.1 AraC family transcriptional regulator ligand-binding domain-containing protein [Sulfitobacter sp. D35]
MAETGAKLGDSCSQGHVHMVQAAQIVASAMRDPFSVIRELGGDMREVCVAGRIAAPDVATGVSTLPLTSFVTFNQMASQRLHAPHFGRLVGSRFDFANIGDVGRAALAAPTLGAALRLVEQAFASVQSDTELRLELQDDEATLSYRILDPDIWPRDQDAELTIGVFRTMIARVAGPGWQPLAMGFEHAPNGADRVAQLSPHCRISYLAPKNFISFPTSLLDRPMPGCAPDRFRRAASDLTRQALASERSAALRTRVRRLIAMTLGTDALDQTHIAQALGMSRRTLRRRLEDEGTGFAELLADCREGHARLLLRQTPLPIPEIAERLGYSEASAFERAFTRRLGITPARFRRTWSPDLS